MDVFTKDTPARARLAFETGCPIIPAAIIGSRELQKPGQVIPNKGKSKVIYGKPIEVEKKSGRPDYPR